MMNLSPTEMDRLVIFTAAEMARRNRRLGIRLSHPEAVAFITDEVMVAARRDMPYEDIRDMAGRLLTTDDVEPGVAQMIPLIYIECGFAEGTKLIALFEPIGPGHKEVEDVIVPGEIVSPEGDIEMFSDLPVVTIDVINTGDRDVQVRSHTHFFEVNRALRFDRTDWKRGGQRQLPAFVAFWRRRIRRKWRSCAIRVPMPRDTTSCVTRCRPSSATLLPSLIPTGLG